MRGETPSPVLEARDLVKRFERPGQAAVTAVSGVSFDVGQGECLGIVGGSGCGKSTVANMVTGLLEPTSGQVLIDGQEMPPRRGAGRELSRHVQMVFQNPAASFDPRRSLGYGVAEILRNFGVPKDVARRRTSALFELCGLDPDLAERHPREVSGGQCQRAAIARALAIGPELIVCDEPTSALDVTVQAQIMRLLQDVQRKSGTAFVLICHDLALVQGFCDRVLVMCGGEVVEQGKTDEVIADPRHGYTRALIRAAQDLSPDRP